jgi:polyisoprenoid-binding protein YceI
MRKQIIVAAALAFSSLVAFAAPQTFSLAGDRHSATVESVTAVETFTGRTSKVTGQIRFDPVAKTGSGVITVNGASLETGNRSRDGHMRSAQWLNFDQFPEIKFETVSVKHLQGDEYEVAGKISLRGQTKDLVTRATLRLLPASEQTRSLGFQGDVVNLRSNFQLKLSDFGVQRLGRTAQTVSDTLNVQINVFGSNR